MKKFILIVLMMSLIVGSASVVLAGWGWDPKKDEAKAKASKVDKKELQAIDTIAMMKQKDPDLKRFFKNAFGYAVFPTVGKGAIGFGGAYGKGIVFQKGNAIGKTSLTQVSWGFQLGGQGYSQIIFFKDKAALKTFTDGNFEFGAGLSAVAITLGASGDTDYSKGVAVFTMTKGGLMYEASISGQKFGYKAYN